MDTFVVDSNFFIQAHRMYYPMDVVPGFWQRVRELAEAGRLVSIDKVKSEIVKNKDGLTEWCENNLIKEFFQDSQTVIQHYIQVAQWADSRRGHYTPSAMDEFLHADEADAWLVAYALADVSRRVIVTHEISQPRSKKRIKIPDACAPFGVQYVNTIELFRRLGVRL